LQSTGDVQETLLLIPSSDEEKLPPIQNISTEVSSFKIEPAKNEEVVGTSKQDKQDTYINEAEEDNDTKPFLNE